MSDDALAVVPWRSADLLPAEEPGPAVIRIGGGKQDDAGAVGVRHEVRVARRDPSLESDVAVPALQAVGAALAVGISLSLLAWAFAWSWRVPVVGLGLAVLAAWGWRQRVVDRLLWAVESWVDHDLTGDGVKGQPAVAFTLTNPAQARAAVAAGIRDEANDAKRAALQAFFDRCLMAGCSERAHGVKAGSGAARDAYIAHRDALFALGLAGWKGRGPNGGWELRVRNRLRAAQLIAKHTL